MNIKTVKAEFKKSKGVLTSIQKLQNRPAKIQWKGVVGASKAFMSSAVAEEVPGHHLFVLQDKEEAAYFLNDLECL